MPAKKLQCRTCRKKLETYLKPDGTRWVDRFCKPCSDRRMGDSEGWVDPYCLNTIAERRKLMKNPILAMLVGALLTAGIAGSLLACGTNAKANDVHVERLYGPDGTTCYVIMQNGNAIGGNCVVN